LLCRWFAKRFLHPDVVAPYEYVFVWDEDLGVDNFDPMEYVHMDPVFLPVFCEIY